MSDPVRTPRTTLAGLCATLATTLLACGERGSERAEVEAATARTDPTAPKARVDPCTGHDLADDKRPRVATIDVSFFLDRELTRGLYLGARWVSPPSYTVVMREPDAARVTLRAALRDGARKSVAGRATWRPARPDVVAVIPDRGEEVTLSVKRAGSTTVQVTCGDATRILTVDASYTADRRLQVAISR